MLGFDQCVECVRAVILLAAMAHGGNPTQADRVASCETGRTYNRTAYNPTGPYIGLYQLGPSKQRQFFARGYDNLYDPAQQANFFQERMALGEANQWSCK